jgi:hypothetical protein
MHEMDVDRQYNRHHFLVTVWAMIDCLLRRSEVGGVNVQQIAGSDVDLCWGIMK